jgi:hypothetical protein
MGSAGGRVTAARPAGTDGQAEVNSRAAVAGPAAAGQRGRGRVRELCAWAGMTQEQLPGPGLRPAQLSPGEVTFTVWAVRARVTLTLTLTVPPAASRQPARAMYVMVPLPTLLCMQRDHCLHCPAWAAVRLRPRGHHGHAGRRASDRNSGDWPGLEGNFGAPRGDLKLPLTPRGLMYAEGP